MNNRKMCHIGWNRYGDRLLLVGNDLHFKKVRKSQHMVLQYPTYHNIAIISYRDSSIAVISYRRASGDSRPCLSGEGDEPHKSTFDSLLIPDVPGNRLTHRENHIVVCASERLIGQIFKVISQSIQCLICQLLVLCLWQLSVTHTGTHRYTSAQTRHTAAAGAQKIKSLVLPCLHRGGALLPGCC